MTDDSPQMPDSAANGSGKRQLSGRLWRLVVKELREILRDRRTILTLVVMPILIYPLLAVVFQRFLLTSLAVNQDVHYAIGVDSEPTKALFENQLAAGEALLAKQEKASASQRGEALDRRDPLGRGGLHRATGPQNDEPPQVYIEPIEADLLPRYVIDSSIHVAVLADRTATHSPETGLRLPMRWKLIYRVGSPTSEAALHYVEARLQAYNEWFLDEQLKQLGMSAALPAATTREPVSFSGAPVFSLAALIPLILVLMTVTGAVYPAIDLTAGERERGTLETLIAAPVPRLGLLMAKYVAVLVVALLTALVNLAGMTVTAHITGLAASLFGDSMSFAVVLKVLLLLCLFAAFFSAILLTLTSCARSFKEAQAYIIPLMLVCLVPGVLCLMPELEFNGWMAVTPLVNIVMLARDLLEGSASNSLAVASVCSTMFYIAAAIALAARIFGTDAILYGSQATWSDLVRRPQSLQPAAGLPAAMLGLALMFSSYFVLGTGLMRSLEIGMKNRLIVSALITATVFGGIPVALATFGRVRWSSGLGLTRPNWACLAGALLLGCSLWPAAHEVFLFSTKLGLSLLENEQMSAARAMVAEMYGLPLWLILLTLAIVPAVFEELSFRGFLFASLRTLMAADRAVIASALLFGVFHEVIFPGRLLTSTFLGLVLGWVRMRSGSIVPGIVLHMVHNGLLLTIAYRHEDLRASGWGLEEQQHLPIQWLVQSALGIFLGVALMIVGTRTSDTKSTQAEL
jgi:ABC-2 type transport system permease protein/sodium transport system permease protein